MNIHRLLLNIILLGTLLPCQAAFKDTLIGYVTNFYSTAGQTIENNSEISLGLLGAGMVAGLYGLYKTHKGIERRVNKGMQAVKTKTRITYNTIQTDLLNPYKAQFKKMQDEELSCGYIARIGLGLAGLFCLKKINDGINGTTKLSSLADATKSSSIKIAKGFSSNATSVLEKVCATKTRSALAVLVTAVGTYATLKYLDDENKKYE